MELHACFSHRRFRGLFWSQFLGALNDSLFKNALVILVLYRGWSLWGMGPELFAVLAGGVFMLPFLLFSAQAGQIADRMEKTVLIRRLKSLELLVATVAVLGLLTQRLDLLLLSLFGFATQSAFFGPVKYSVLPQLLDDGELLGGNALVETATSLAILGGTILGGILAAVHPVSVAAAVVLIALMGRLAASEIPDTGKPENRNEISGWWSAQLECLKLTTETRPMLLTVLGISWFWLFGGAFLTLLPLYSRQVLQGSEGVTTILLAAFSVGIGLGSVLCEKLSAGRLELGWVPLGSLGMTLFALDFSLRQQLDARMLFDLTGLAVSAGIFIVPLYTFLQKRGRAEDRSRLVAGNNLWNSLFMVTSTLTLMGLVAHRVPLTEIFAGLAVLNLLVALAAYRKLPEFTLRLAVVFLCNICYKLKIKGRSRIPQEGPCLLIANHVTLVDWLFLAAGTDRPVRFVMWHTFYNMPVLHFLFRDGGAIPIGSKNSHPEIFEKAFDSIHEALKNGEMVIIFPEGKLTRDGEIDRFRKGVEAILERDPVPVLPVALKGLWGTRFSCAPDRRWHFQPVVEMVIGEPLAPSGLRAQQMREVVLELAA